MDEIYKVLGWQGGTVHEIIAEIKRLKQIELHSVSLLQCLHFDAQTKNFKPKKWQIDKLQALDKAINQY